MKSALKRFGGGGFYLLGKTIRVTVRQVENVFYVEGLFALASGDNSPMIFAVYRQGDQYIAIGWHGDSLFEQQKGAKKTENFELHEPADCTPHFAPDTPQKSYMMKNVLESVVIELSSFNAGGPVIYPRHLRIVVPNFNTDYPLIPVLIPKTKEIYDVVLHNEGSNPFEDDFLPNHQYNVGQDFEEFSYLEPKILKYGKRYWINPAP